MSTDDELLSHEIECHQFTEPLKPPAHPPNMVRRLVARASGRVWFRVGWTCPHLKAVLESAETEMLLKGKLNDHLDIYQLQGGASASAGTHSLPGAADLGQTSDEQIDILRLNGGRFQKRTPAEGFVLHAHGFTDCGCGSSALLYQKRLWNRRLNGLVNMGRIIGRWPVKHWSTAIGERKKVIVALKDDIINGVVAKLKPELDDISKRVRALPNAGQVADAVLTRDGKIENVYGDAKTNPFIALATALRNIGRQVNQLTANVAEIKGKIAP